jgi:hypothetical protein
VKNILAITVLTLGLVNAQGITNTLGGDTADDKFTVENISSEAGLVVTGEGNVGIGVTSPEGTLHSRQYGDDSKQLILGNSNQPSLEWFFQVDNSANLSLNNEGISNSPIYISNTGNIAIGTNDPIDSKVMVETETQNVGVRAHVFNNSAKGIWGTGWGDYASGVLGEGIGINGSGVDGIGTKYGVKGEASASAGLHYGGFFETNNPSGRGVYATSSTSTGSAYGGVFEAFNSSDGIGAYAKGKKYDFYAAGTGTNYGTSSSIRWKNNVIEIDNPLEKLAELRGVYFDWDEEHGGQHDVGCIAEEVGKVLPEIVVYEENGIDADGMDYSKFTPLLIEAIKALQKRVEELENK